MGQVLQELVSIPPKTIAPSVRQARRLLDGTHRSVDDILAASQELERIRRSSNHSTKGRRKQREVDLLRAAIVFSSAGIDACMTRLVNDSGRVLIRSPRTGAHRQFREFLKQEIPVGAVNSELRERLLDLDIEESVLTYYISKKMKASFQGSGDLQRRVVTVLGLPKSTLSQASVDGLDQFFKARNEIVHEMDFAEGTGRSAARRPRGAVGVQDQCYSALNTAAELINATIAALSGAGLR